MGVPRLAKHAAGVSDAAAGSILGTSLEDEAVTHAKLDHDGDFEMDDLSAGLVTASKGVVTKKGSGADILIATLTTAFGDPAGIADGTLFIYAETTSNPDKIYLVMVHTGAFWLEELTAAAAA